MQKLRDAKLNVLPYAELTVKPADVRPIVVVMKESLSDCEVSIGSADDMAELITILGVMRSVALAVLNVRLMAEANKSGIDSALVVGDDPPLR